MPRCCQNCFLIRYHNTLGYSCKATKNYIARADVDLKRADDCPLVEIVTCKDCKHNKNGVCPNYRRFVEDNFYCADGERRE